MSRLRPEKLHVTLGPSISAEGPITPRFYTLTHSDVTGDLFLTVDIAYDREKISGLYTRLMRDEVLAEWHADKGPAELHVHCHVSGGFVLGWASMRLAIFKREMPLVLEALRFGDRRFFSAHPDLDQAAIFVLFHAKERRYNRAENWGSPADYLPPSRAVAARHTENEDATRKGA